MRSMNSRISLPSVVSSICATFDAGEALSQGRRILVAAVHRSVEGQLGGGHAARRAHVLDRVLERRGDFVVGRLAAQLL